MARRENREQRTCAAREADKEGCACDTEAAYVYYTGSNQSTSFPNAPATT